MIAVRWHDHWENQSPEYHKLNVPLWIEIYNFGEIIFRVVLKIKLAEVRPEKWDHLWSVYFRGVLSSPTHAVPDLLAAIEQILHKVDLTEPPVPIITL